MRKYLTTGLFSAILGIVIGGAPADAALVSRGFLDEALENYATTTALDLKADNADLTNLSNKIGELPDSAPTNMWYTVTSFSEPVPVSPGAELPETLGGQLDFWLSGPESVMEHFARMLVMDGGSLEDDTSTPDDDFLGLWPLTQEVKNIEENITLPSGEIIPSKGLALLLPETLNSTYPTSIRNFMTDIYTGYWGIASLAEAVYHGNAFMGQTDTAFQVKGLRQITDEIGTLPSGNVVNSPLADTLNMLVQNTENPVYPDSLAKLIEQIYGNTPEHPGILTYILYGYPNINEAAPVSSEFIGIFPAIQIAENANSLATSARTIATAAKTAADANTAKIGTVPDGKNLAGMIGTLPTGYDSVGAALTAIKGIAEDAKAAALSAIPDPKTEGSTGKYVLTVDIVGDNATYRWEKIDREGETTTTTE